MIENAASECARVHAILAGIQGAPERALLNATNRALVTVRSETGKQIRNVYTISQKNLRTDTTIRTRRANKNNPIGEIYFSGYKIPLYRFDVSPKEPTPGKPVKIRLLKSKSPITLRHAFIDEMSNGHTGVFERTGKQGISARLAKAKNGANWHTQKIKEMMGLSMAQMARNSVVLEKVEQKAEETFVKRAEHEIERILNQYGR